MKRVAIATICVVTLVLGLGRAVAARAGAEVVTFPVNFTITSAGCPNLPNGTTITGSGTEQSINTTLERNGVITLINSSHAFGTATDQDGNTYVFDYSNESRGILSESGVITGQMSDHFSLAGNGPARLTNGFIGDFTFDLISLAFSLDPKHSFGDPIDFGTGLARCDPL